MSKHDRAYYMVETYSFGRTMDEQAREAFAKEFNRTVGELLHSLREKSGVSLDHVAQALAASRLEKIKRIESGAESLHGLELLELIRIYGADAIEVNTSIQTIGMEIRSRFLANGLPPNNAPCS